MADEEYASRARALMSGRYTTADDIAAALRAERMRGRREGLERAAEEADEHHPGIGEEFERAREARNDITGAIRAIDPESW